MATLQELFVEYDKADAEWEQKKTELEEATRVRSDKVKAIAQSPELKGKKKITRKGATLTIVARPSKDGSAITYFFRGGKSEDTVEI